MKIANRLRKRTTSAAVTAGAVALAGAVASAGLAMSASAAPGAPANTSHAATSSGTASNVRTLDNTNGFEASPVTKTVTLHLSLTPMPRGHLVLTTKAVGLAMYGLTPGSSHKVAVSVPGLVVPVGTLTANSVGVVHWSVSLPTVTSALAQHGIHLGVPGASPPSIQLVILDAGQGTPVIAETSVITGLGRQPFYAVEPGRVVVKPGSATIVYNPDTKTVSVTVNATGLTPGAHVAHIHVGSCQQQGAVAYTLMPDFTANSHGVISNETRTVKGVTAAKMSGGWYLNLHQGNSRNIVTSSGQPTINFRPLLCANI
jgi:hypothetical protein